MTDIVASALITNVAIIIVAIIAKYDKNKLMQKVNEVHKEVNGMKTELVSTAGKLGEAIGNARGRHELKQENKQDIQDIEDRDNFNK